MTYQIIHIDDELVFSVVVDGRQVAGFNTLLEAREYVGECEQHDRDVTAGQNEYVFARERGEGR